ncbi:hypothetical protein YC2023_050524 [Brassica napus]
MSHNDLGEKKCITTFITETYDQYPSCNTLVFFLNYKNHVPQIIALMLDAILHLISFSFAITLRHDSCVAVDVPRNVVSGKQEIKKVLDRNSQLYAIKYVSNTVRKSKKECGNGENVSLGNIPSRHWGKGIASDNCRTLFHQTLFAMHSIENNLSLPVWEQLSANNSSNEPHIRACPNGRPRVTSATFPSITQPYILQKSSSVSLNALLITSADSPPSSLANSANYITKIRFLLAKLESFDIGMMRKCDYYEYEYKGRDKLRVRHGRSLCFLNTTTREAALKLATSLTIRVLAEIEIDSTGIEIHMAETHFIYFRGKKNRAS